jgi:signal transduction histidine kinase
MTIFRVSARGVPATLALCSVELFSQLSSAEAATAGPLPGACTFGCANSLLIWSVLGGSAIAGALGAIAFRQKARFLSKHLTRQNSKLDALAEADAAYRALVSIERQCCIVWNAGVPRLVLHTIEAVSGVPQKLSQLLRFGSWLHAEDAGRTAGSLERLLNLGEPFSSTASTLEGHLVEITGGTSGADVVLRIRPFLPVNKELVRLIGENKRLRQAVQDRDCLLDSLPSPAWIRDHKGALSWVNAAYVSAVNSGGREEVLRTQMELFETRQRAELSRLSQSKKSGRVRLQTIVNGAVQIYEAITASLTRGSAGVALDVAPLAIAKDELERQMTAHSRTLNKVATAVAIFGADRKLVYSNEALAHIWKLEEEWLAGKPSATEFLDLLRQRRLVPEQSNYRRWRDERILTWDRNRPLDEFWHLPDGRTVHILSDYRDDGGVTFLFDEVTEKLALERQYHGLIEGQRETLDHLSEGIAVFAPDGKLQLFNPAFQAIWALPDALIELGPHLEEIVFFCEKTAPDEALWDRAREAITNIQDARDIASGVAERTDGSHLAYAITPLPDGGTLLTFTDITDSKRMEVVLLERNEALEAADRLKSTFLSHVSYELRTPLTSIIGFTDLLASPHAGGLTGKQVEYLNDIRTSSQVLLTIINDILDLAVIDAGALDLKLAPVNVKDIIEGAELGVRERLSRSKVNLDVHIANGIDTVVADENRLTQVLYNLLLNAIGFSPEGGTITLACRREKNGVAFSVQDTGLGIPEEEQAAVFERFETRSQGSRHRGAGLGLSLVKSLVELHNGRIDLRSTPGAGTTVTVFLPDRHAALQQKNGHGSDKASSQAIAAQS